MDVTGKINGITIDLDTRLPIVALQLNNGAVEGLKELVSCEKLDIRIKKHKEKRSLDANAYYWVLITKLAKVLDTSNAELHNIELRKYGQIERVGGKLIAIPLPDTDETEKNVLQKEEYHLKPTSQVTLMKGELCRTYIMLRGSSTYNTEEMARLISGLITDCRDAGIPDHEIMSPFEKQKLKEQYGIE